MCWEDGPQKEEPVVQQKIDKCAEVIESFASIGLQRYYEQL